MFEEAVRTASSYVDVAWLFSDIENRKSGRCFLHRPLDPLPFDSERVLKRHSEATVTNVEWRGASRSKGRSKGRRPQAG